MKSSNELYFKYDRISHNKIKITVYNEDGEIINQRLHILSSCCKNHSFEDQNDFEVLCMRKGRTGRSY